MKLVEFIDLEAGEKHYGFQLANGDIACACCGSIYTADEETEMFIVTKQIETDLEKIILNEMGGKENV